MDNKTNIAKLEKLVRYYEDLHKKAREGIEIAMALSGEMKERRIEAQVKLDQAKKSQEIK